MSAHLSDAEKARLTQKHENTLKLRKEYIKQMSNPYRHGTKEGGIIFDAGITRFQAMTVSHIEHFKPTPKSFKTGMFLVVLPICLYAWLLKSDRDAKEHKYRTGQVAYKDRNFKFI
ncbi:uncharacterized protein LOC119678224 [Teleopsis dalmanni]|uniref:uncharacterized protein LOC119678224 n=1 Tax=Teleopsis dalmanni TaxID=139649 RepID=UPI0018CEFBAE|nr:uncharacterized protein LOC119678224 [Teleopsis dalmanni]